MGKVCVALDRKKLANFLESITSIMCNGIFCMKALDPGTHVNHNGVNRDLDTWIQRLWWNLQTVAAGFFLTCLEIKCTISVVRALSPPCGWTWTKKKGDFSSPFAKVISKVFPPQKAWYIIRILKSAGSPFINCNRYIYIHFKSVWSI